MIERTLEGGREGEEAGREMRLDGDDPSLLGLQNMLELRSMLTCGFFGVCFGAYSLRRGVQQGSERWEDGTAPRSQR